MSTVTPEALERLAGALKSANNHLIGEAKHHRTIAEATALLAALPELLAAQPASSACQTCEPGGVFATDGTGPYDCYTCRKPASSAGEVEQLRVLCGCAYQLAGYHDAPEAWLDMLGDAAAGVPLAQWRQQGDPIETLLPYAPVAGEAVQQGALAIALAMTQGWAWDGIRWHAPAPAAVPADELKDAVSVLLELPQLHGKQAQWAQPVIARVRAALASQPQAPAAAVPDGLIADWRKRADEAATSDNVLCQKIANCLRRCADELAAIAPQPAAPQGVDLGQFRVLVEFAKHRAVMMNLFGYEEEANRLLALIDSQHQQQESGNG